MTNKMTEFLNILRQEFGSFRRRVHYRMYVTKLKKCEYTDNTALENCEMAITHCEDIFMKIYSSTSSTYHVNFNF